MERDGFTVVEVLVALTLLAVVVLGLGSTTARLGRTAVDNGQRIVALELLQDRLRTIAMDEEYGELETRYAGVEEEIPGFEGFRRTTTIERIFEPGKSGRTLDYHRVTVTVEGPGLQTPVARTTTIAAP